MNKNGKKDMFEAGTSHRSELMPQLDVMDEIFGAEDKIILDNVREIVYDVSNELNFD